MNKLERVDAVLAGKIPDRIPVSLWYHFGSQFLPGEKYADLVLDFYRTFKFDWLKVMNDYFYPMPEGMLELKSKEDLKLIRPFDIEKSAWGEQLKAIKILHEKLAKEVYFCDTVFDPYQELQKSLVGEHMPRLMKEEPEALLAALDVVTENVIAYAKKSLAAGSSGIFLSVLASEDQLPREDYLRFDKPFAMRVFEAVKGLGKMNTAHIHGHKIYTNDVLDFPVSVLSWEDRVPTNPSLAEVKRLFPGCVMGGIDNRLMTRKTPAFLARGVREGLALGGEGRFFLANGCSIPGWMDHDGIHAMVAEAQGKAHGDAKR
jgi:uroporphyrinogen decarboxylase